MAHIIPFRGYRYNPEIVGSVSDVVTPPYDRVYPDVQDACYRRSPYNIVRIIKGRVEASDSERSNVYTCAADHLEMWMKEHILIRDAEPGLYAYHQTYSFEGETLTRRGLIALGALEPEKVHAHEKTLRGPKEDRLKLMRATEANFGHIFMLYDDPKRVTAKVLAESLNRDQPLIEARDADGNLHQVWRITDPGIVQQICDALTDKDLYIADGHHRYETAVTYMRECEQRDWRPAAPESFHVRMMTLFNIAEPGMSIRPIHRLIHGLDGFNAEAFLEDAAQYFQVARHNSLGDMVAAVKAGRSDHTFGCVAQGVFATLALKGGQIPAGLISDEYSDEYKHLDVTILQTVLLEGLLGIDAEALEEQRNVTYTVDADEGIAAVRAGTEQLFFYLNATLPEEVVRVADHGEKMPQKSTDFYPKLLTGLVLSKMEIEK